MTSCRTRLLPPASWRVVCGLVGFFLVLRAQTLPATRCRMSASPVPLARCCSGFRRCGGLVTLTLAAGVGMGLLGEQLYQRDVAIGIVLAMSLGLGLLFRTSSPPMPRRQRRCCSATSLGSTPRPSGHCCCSALPPLRHSQSIARPLLFASLQPELAEAKGVSLRLLSVLFLAIVAIGVAECVQIVGVLLVFASDGWPRGIGAASHRHDSGAAPRCPSRWP